MFSVLATSLAPWWPIQESVANPRIRLDWNDKDDRQHVIVKAHLRWAKNDTSALPWEKAEENTGIYEVWKKNLNKFFAI
jgi:hypothetical protein